MPPPLTRPNRVPTAGLSTLVRVAAHLATKLAALVDRPDSAPGDKDRHEIMALLGQNASTPDAVGVAHDASARKPAEATTLIARRSNTSATFVSTAISANPQPARPRPARPFALTRTQQQRRPSGADRPEASPTSTPDPTEKCTGPYARRLPTPATTDGSTRPGLVDRRLITRRSRVQLPPPSPIRE
jgi:hypothetical protein